MTALAPTLEAFFVERLINQKDASPRTIAAYRECAARRLVVSPAQPG
jgi:integrase/recombinase XerD